MNQNQYGMGKKTLKLYVLGFLSCLLLTIIPFYSVMHSSLSRGGLLVSIVITAVIQLMVQVICFLRVNTRDSEAVTNLLSLLMIVIVLFILLGGSLWIMYNLNYNMVH